MWALTSKTAIGVAPREQEYGNSFADTETKAIAGTSRARRMVAARRPRISTAAARKIPRSARTLSGSRGGQRRCSRSTARSLANLAAADAAIACWDTKRVFYILAAGHNHPGGGAGQQTSRGGPSPDSCDLLPAEASNTDPEVEGSEPQD
jgi:hypothetical protein